MPNATRTTQDMPPLQLSLLGIDYLREAWRQHRKHLPGYTLDQALEHEWYGRVIRCHAACLERQQKRGKRR